MTLHLGTAIKNKYLCRKTVKAFKIARIESNEKPRREGDFLEHAHFLFDKHDGSLEVGQGYMNKHQPQVGGYYVEYSNDYASYSPAQPFEEGYSLIK